MAVELHPLLNEELAWSALTTLVSYAGMACFVCFSICCPWSIPISLYVRQHPEMFTPVADTEDDEKTEAARLTALTDEAGTTNLKRTKSVDVREEGFEPNSEVYARLAAPQGPSDSRESGVRNAVLAGMHSSSPESSESFQLSGIAASPEPAGVENWITGSKVEQKGGEGGQSLQSIYLQKKSDGSPLPRKITAAAERVGPKGVDSPNTKANASNNIWQRLTGMDSPKSGSPRTPKKEDQYQFWQAAARRLSDEGAGAMEKVNSAFNPRRARADEAGAARGEAKARSESPLLRSLFGLGSPTPSPAKPKMKMRSFGAVPAPSAERGGEARDGATPSVTIAAGARRTGQSPEKQARTPPTPPRNIPQADAARFSPAPSCHVYSRPVSFNTMY
jgi:hypothetical protein